MNKVMCFPHVLTTTISSLNLRWKTGKLYHADRRAEDSRETLLWTALQVEALRSDTVENVKLKLKKIVIMSISTCI